jgi:phospholipid/cholesterol/gamma-HCH transport system substrate-binding protein
VFGALSRDEQALANLVTDLNTTVGAIASEDDSLRAAIPALRDVLRVGKPALESIDSAFPSIRAFARDALPGAETSVATLDAQIPFIKQARGLVSEEEARGLTEDLRPTIPALAQLTKSSTRSFEQTRALAKCQNEVLLPFSKTPINDPGFPNHTGDPYYKEQPRAFVGLAGESRLADANTAFFRVLVGTGPTTVFSTGDLGQDLYGQLPGDLNGQRPPRPATPPKFRPDLPCELQEPPILDTPNVPGDSTVRPKPVMDADARKRDRQGDSEIAAIEQHLKDAAAGRPTLDPLQFSEEGLKIQSRLQGLEQLSGGRYREKKGGSE